MKNSCLADSMDCFAVQGKLTFIFIFTAIFCFSAFLPRISQCTF